MFILILVSETMKTKDRIIEGAIDLFNQRGFSNVSMQRLADHLGLSPGNLTYHFPKKQDLMLALYDEFQKEILQINPTNRTQKPDLIQIDQQIDAFHQFQQRFLFFYLDILEIERAYPQIARKHQTHIKGQIGALQQSLEHNKDLGFLHQPGEPFTFWDLAEQLWFTAVFWHRRL